MLPFEVLLHLALLLDEPVGEKLISGHTGLVIYAALTVLSSSSPRPRTKFIFYNYRNPLEEFSARAYSTPTM